jgi:leucyl-tRNA synthetase
MSVKFNYKLAENFISEEEIKNAVTAHAEIAPLLEGKTIKKCIIVKGRLINLIVA